MDHKHAYRCEPCGFHTTCKRDYERHLLTQKHLDGGGLIKQIVKSSEGYLCSSCHNIFRSRTSIYKHISKCKMCSSQGSRIHTTKSSGDIVVCVDDKITITKEMFMTLLQNNQEMMKMLRVLSDKPNTTNNTTNNSNNTITNSNNTNNTFNMNLFLNEKCKDAMNMKDFVNSIQLNMTDLENVGTMGYVEGMSNILINNLQKMDVYKRPVHCSDVKRETLYVKDNNEWARDGPDHPKMVNAVLAVEQKNVALVGEWAKANPRCMNSNTRENEKYFKLSRTVTDGDKEGNIAKVIKRVATKVAVEKESHTNGGGSALD
jgi:hypothetical protein